MGAFVRDAAVVTVGIMGVVAIMSAWETVKRWWRERAREREWARDQSVRDARAQAARDEANPPRKRRR